jgi:hypothetical protein
MGEPEDEYTLKAGTGYHAIVKVKISLEGVKVGWKLFQ